MSSYYSICESFDDIASQKIKIFISRKATLIKNLKIQPRELKLWAYQKFFLSFM